MACLGPRAVGKRLPLLCGWHRQRGVSKVGAGQATSAGTPPAHSILLWRPALFRQVTLSKCSTMLLHTPGFLLCYENRTKHAKEGKKKKKLGRVGVRGRAEQPATHSLFLSGLSSSGQHCLTSRAIKTRASKRGLRSPGMNTHMLYLIYPTSFEGDAS